MFLTIVDALNIYCNPAPATIVSIAATNIEKPGVSLVAIPHQEFIRRSMYVYRIKKPTVAITRDQGKATLIRLSAGTEVRTRKAGPKLPGSGMVDIEIIRHSRIAAMFMEDLEERGERVEAESA
jgi:hypothetical protein